MNEVTLIGIDLGKHSFHLHAQDATGRMVFRKKLSRQQLLRTLANVPSCRVVMEACAGSHWLARQLAGMGHEPRLISPQFVRPFVAGNKNDFGDAQAICEAACRPSMRFVSPRNEAQQTVSALHRLRERWVRERTATVNQMHGFLLEFGISLPRGAALMSQWATVLDHETLPRAWWRLSCDCARTSITSRNSSGRSNRT
jgi:transposase